MSVKATFYMKSGSEIVVKCESVSIKEIGGDIQSYEIKGMDEDKVLYIRVEDIEAIVYK